MAQHAIDPVHLTPDDYQRLRELRRQSPARVRMRRRLTLGQHVADTVAAAVGSWRFIIVQSGLLAVWIVVNVVAFAHHWDPYPFILLNLLLSFQAAYTAPVIMMSQNRQAEIDRRQAAHDYRVNVKAELEIELLHHKIDVLREHEIARLTQVIERLTAHLAPEIVAAMPQERTGET